MMDGIQKTQYNSCYSENRRKKICMIGQKINWVCCFINTFETENVKLVKEGTA